MAASQVSSESSETALLYEIRDTPNKGKGMFATSTIAPGTLIVSEAPLFRIPDSDRLVECKETFTQYIIAALKGLKKDQQRAFLSLSNDYKGEPGVHPFVGIAWTNPTIVLDAETQQGGFFLTTSRVNHSCLPNAARFWDPTTQRANLHALQNMSENEEITIDDMDDTDWMRPRDERRKIIDDEYHFSCLCSLCTSSEEIVAASDKRRVQIGNLHTVLEHRETLRLDPALALSYCKETLDLLQQEGEAEFRLRGFPIYWHASRICAMHSDWARASVFAGKAVLQRRSWHGEDEGDKKFEEKIVQPQNHWEAGAFPTWTTSMMAMEGPMARGEIDTWLWERASDKNAAHGVYQKRSYGQRKLLRIPK